MGFEYFMSNLIFWDWILDFVRDFVMGWVLYNSEPSNNSNLMK